MSILALFTFNGGCKICTWFAHGLYMVNLTLSIAKAVGESVNMGSCQSV